MEQIASILTEKKKSVCKDMQMSCRNLSANAIKLLSKYNDVTSFLNALNPDKQIIYCSEPSRIRRCYTDNFPTLSEIKQAYGNGASSAWLVPQIVNLSEFCGCKGKLTENQIKELALIISSRYSYLKVSEIMLFFFNFKAGKYGEFYGNVDPMKIMSAMNSFVSERIRMLDKIDEEKRKQEDADRENSHVDCKRLIDVLDKHINNNKKKNNDEEYRILSIAEGIVNTVTDKEHYDIMIAMFKKKYGLYPQEYINKYKK